MKLFIRFVLVAFFTSAVASAVPPSQPGQSANHRPDKERREGTVLFEVKKNLTGPQKAALANVRGRYGLTSQRMLLAGKIDQSKASNRGGATEEDICNDLLESGAVVFAEPDYLEEPFILPNDPEYSRQWQHINIRSAEAWNLTTGNATVIAAVCDTGVDSDHPDLVGNLILPGFNSVDNTTNSEDSHGHGTFVAGCISAVGNNSTGVAGVAWNVKILPIRISNLDTGLAYHSDMAEAMRYAVDHGAKIVNLSYGGAYSSTIDSAAKYVRSKGGLHFMSAGNDNTDISANPDWASFVIVGATDRYDNRASFSNYGTPIDVTAPGVSVYATKMGGGYGSWSGTSFSSPIAAGVGALIYSINPSFTPDQVEGFLFSSAKDIGAAGEDSVYGHGLVDAAAAVQVAVAALSNPPPTAVVSATPTSGYEPLQVFFNGAASSDDGSVVAYSWNFGDGATGSGAGISHTYLSAGTYNAVLTVTDNHGLTDSDSVTILVNPDPYTLFAPSGLSASASGNTVILSWDDNSLVENGTHIERGTTRKGRTTWTRVATVGANITTYSETISSGTYLYRVQAFNTTDGLSGYSETVQIKVGSTGGGGKKKR